MDPVTLSAGESAALTVRTVPSPHGKIVLTVSGPGSCSFAGCASGEAECPSDADTRLVIPIGATDAGEKTLVVRCTGGRLTICGTGAAD